MFIPRALTICLMFTDTSDDGYRGFNLKRLNKEVCSAKFKYCEKQISSIHRELLAVKYVLDSFGEMSQNQSVQVNIDNKVLVEFYLPVVLSHIYRILLLMFLIFVQS